MLQELFVWYAVEQYKMQMFQMQHADRFSLVGCLFTNVFPQLIHLLFVLLVKT